MSIFTLIVLIVLFMVILTFTAVLKVAFTLDTEREKTRVVALWLYPFLKVVADIDSGGPVLAVSLFNKTIYRGKTGLKKKGTKGAALIRAVSTSDIHLSVRYGFKDPYVTGITCGAINAAAEYVNFASVRQTPDFVSESDYVLMTATADVNVGNTLVNWLKRKTSRK